jgi:hypothetical protein
VAVEALAETPALAVAPVVLAAVEVEQHITCPVVKQLTVLPIVVAVVVAQLRVT